jgi:hypothetical protein
LCRGNIRAIYSAHRANIVISNRAKGKKVGLAGFEESFEWKAIFNEKIIGQWVCRLASSNSSDSFIDLISNKIHYSSFDNRKHT